METKKEITVLNSGQVATTQTRAVVTQMKEQVQIIQEAMRDVMQDGTHYGLIPGVTKNCLFKAGAEKLSMLFRLIPRFTVDERKLERDHREYFITCELFSGGEFAGQGVGSCSTMESKYRYRKGGRVCPECGKDSIIASTDFKTKEPNGFLCFGKKGGCGAKFPIGSHEHAELLNAPTDRVENADIADVYNTVLKMAKKRAHVDAIITATAASDIFTQDLEEGLQDPDGNPIKSDRSNDRNVKPDAIAALKNPLAHQMTTNNPKVLGARIGSFLKDQIEWLSRPQNGQKLTPEDRANVLAAHSAIGAGTYDGLLAEYREIFGSDPVPTDEAVYSTPPFEN